MSPRFEARESIRTRPSTVDSTVSRVRRYQASLLELSQRTLRCGDTQACIVSDLLNARTAQPRFLVASPGEHEQDRFGRAANGRLLDCPIEGRDRHARSISTTARFAFPAASALRCCPGRCIIRKRSALQPFLDLVLKVSRRSIAQAASLWKLALRFEVVANRF